MKLGFVLVLHPWIVEAGCVNPSLLTACIRTHIFMLGSQYTRCADTWTLRDSLLTSSCTATLRPLDRGAFWQTGVLDTTDWFQFRDFCEGYTAVILTDSIQNSFNLINWSLVAQHPSTSYQYLGIRRSDSAHHMLSEYRDGALLKNASKIQRWDNWALLFLCRLWHGLIRWKYANKGAQAYKLMALQTSNLISFWFSTLISMHILTLVLILLRFCIW